MNAYLIILLAVTLGGIGISIWGWRIRQRSQQVVQWPIVEGRIDESTLGAEQNDLLPHILYSYVVGDQSYRKVFEFPTGTHPLPEFTQAYLEKYPVGTIVSVYYNPDQPQDSTLEPATQGDWMILALGILMTVGGLGALATAL